MKLGEMRLVKAHVKEWVKLVETALANLDGMPRVKRGRMLAEKLEGKP